MGRILLHAGMHKTGTSSVQASLSRGLNDPGVLYLDLGEPNHSGPLVNLFGLTPERYHGNLKRGRTVEDLAKIRARLRTSFDQQMAELGDRIAIVSAEDLCRFKRRELESLRDAFTAYGHATEVVIYVRPPRGYIGSAFQQLIKGGLSSFDLTAAYPEYSNLCLFPAVFGVEFCKFRLFDRNRFKDNDILVDLLHHLKPGLKPLASLMVNEGISLSALKFLYIYRKYGPGYGADPDAIRRNNGLVARLSRLSGPKLQIAAQLTDTYFHERKDDLNLLQGLLDAGEFRALMAEPESTAVNVSCEEDLLRIDPCEAEALISLAEGFGVTIPTSTEAYRDPELVATSVSQFIPLLLPTESATQKQPLAKYPMVISGAEQFLFLAGGSHSPFDFATGRRKVSPESIRTFWANIRRRREQMRKRKVAYAHLIVPDKHNICSDVFPRPLSVRLADAYLSDHPAENPDLCESVLYPIDALKACFRDSCTRVDSHLTPFGSILCVQALISLLKQTGQPPLSEIDHTPELISSIVLIKQDWAGDLGSKLIPNRMEPLYRLARPRSIKFFSNRFMGGNNGICDLYINLKHDETGPRVLIFGDSFGRSLAGVIARLVRQVVFCRTPHLHVELVDQLRPTHVITESVERYLSSVISDSERSNFWLYPHFKDKPYHPPLDFIEAINAMMAYGRPMYRQFIDKIRDQSFDHNHIHEDIIS